MDAQMREKQTSLMTVPGCESYLFLLTLCTRLNNPVDAVLQEVRFAEGRQYCPSNFVQCRSWRGTHDMVAGELIDQEVDEQHGLVVHALASFTQPRPECCNRSPLTQPRPGCCNRPFCSGLHRLHTHGASLRVRLECHTASNTS